ncbi:AAA family ATPase [Anaerovibrio sp.]|uniref:uridine kinase family protein n=1 Tax=Anaerovibrio sp. TaxID=1872532 RepID=UPI0025C2E9DD|nr:AAA family ATPase [Anaerovibrio sp.]MBR2142171.1 AAA family ATPase [Anaerovibrio sp.]
MFTYFDDILAKLLKLADNGKRNIVAIDGRCGAGKTTLASYLQEKTGATVFHLDDFFLRPEQRTVTRLEQPGENVDHERFFSEVLEPLRAGAIELSYQRFDCKTQLLQEAVNVKAGNLCIVEGAYSCHSSLINMYDFRIFVTVSPEEQLERIIKRNGREGAEVFKKRWIPLEEKYFAAYSIEDKCDYCLNTKTSLPVHRRLTWLP